MRVLLLVSLIIVGSLGVVTLVALEGQEVVVLRTFDATGQAHDTRTWIADADGSGWIEAATLERPFLRHIQAHPEVEVVRPDRVRRYHATPLPNPDGHERIRRLLAEKYGWADWWIGLLQNTSASVAIRLEPRG